MKKDFNQLLHLVTFLATKKATLDEKKILAINAIPELGQFEFYQCNHPAHQYNDILKHTIVAVENVDKYIETEDNISSYELLIMRLTLLLHDIGKTVKRTIDDDGITHFKGHPKESAIIADRILNQYDIEDKLKQTIINLIVDHDTNMNPDNNIDLMNMINKIGFKETKLLLKIQRADLNAHATWFAKKKSPILNRLESLYQSINMNENN